MRFVFAKEFSCLFIDVNHMKRACTHSKEYSKERMTCLLCIYKLRKAIEEFPQASVGASHRQASSQKANPYEGKEEGFFIQSLLGV